MELNKLPDPFSLTFQRLPYSSNMESSDDHHSRPQFRTSYTPNSEDAMREMIFRMAAFQSVKPPKRRNVKISKDPQSVAARHRREKISERIRILQRLVPGGMKMDTASMLEEAVRYMKFLKHQVRSLEQAAAGVPVVWWSQQ